MTLLLLSMLVQDAPWKDDLQATRDAALKAGKPCVLILNVDSSAL